MNCENQQGSLDFQKIYKNAWQLFLLGEHRKCCKYIQEATQNYQLYDLHEPDYFRLLALHIRMLLELDRSAELMLVVSFLKLLSAKTQPSCDLYYCLTMAEFCNKNFDTFESLIEKTIDLSVKQANYEYLTQALILKSIYLKWMNKLVESRSIIDKVQPLLDFLSMDRIHHSYFLTKALIADSEQKYQESLDLLFKASEYLKKEKSLLLHAYVFRTLGKVHMNMGQIYIANSYLKMAGNLLDSLECVRLSNLINIDFENLNQQIQISSMPSNDWSTNENSVYHPLKGRIEFKGQQTLIIFLKLLLSSPNKVFSKEEIVHTLWQEKYNPLIHDNRIYVTVKRLRACIESNYKSPQFLIRRKNGYLLNQSNL